MDRRQEKRIIYICLLGFAAIMPIAINPWYGPYISLISIFCVLRYIQSDRKMMDARQGFPVVVKEECPTMDASMEQMRPRRPHITDENELETPCEIPSVPVVPEVPAVQPDRDE